MDLILDLVFLFAGLAGIAMGAVLLKKSPKRDWTVEENRVKLLVNANFKPNHARSQMPFRFFPLDDRPERIWEISYWVFSKYCGLTPHQEIAVRSELEILRSQYSQLPRPGDKLLRTEYPVRLLVAAAGIAEVKRYFPDLIEERLQLATNWVRSGSAQSTSFSSEAARSILLYLTDQCLKSPRNSDEGKGWEFHDDCCDGCCY